MDRKDENVVNPASSVYKSVADEPWEYFVIYLKKKKVIAFLFQIKIWKKRKRKFLLLIAF